MPSVLHEALRHLFEVDRGFVLDLLDRTGADIRGYEVVGTLPTSVSVPQLDADACIELRDADGRAWIIVVEIQLRIDEDKRWSWPVYAAEAARRARAPASVLVLTVDVATERWARALAVTDRAGTRFAPLVAGPECIRRCASDAEPDRHPALALVGALAAPDDAGLASRALRGIVHLPEGDATLYFDLLDATLEGAARRALEELMMQGWRPQGPTLKKYWNEGREEGLEKGREEGHAHSLAVILEARGFTLSDAQRERIAGASLETLERWIAAAVHAATVEDALR